MEPEQIELLAVMTDAVVQLAVNVRQSAHSASRCCVCALSSESIHGLNCHELLHTT